MLKFTVDAQGLLEVVKRAHNFIPTRTVENKFYCLRLDVSQSDIVVSCQKPGEAKFMEVMPHSQSDLTAVGYFIIKSEKLLNLLASLSGPVQFAVGSNNIAIRSGGATFSLQQEQEGYQPFDDRGDVMGSFMPCTDWLMRSLRAAAVCCGYNDQRAALRGVNLSLDAMVADSVTLQIFGTDSVRIALAEDPVMVTGGPSGFIWHRAIYQKAARSVADLLDPAHGCTVAMLSGGPLFQQGNWRVFCQGIPTFTNDPVAMLERGMPFEDAEIPAADLAWLLRQANLAAEEQAVQVTLKESTIAVFSQRAGGHITANAAMPMNHGGAPRELWLNGRLLLSFCELAGESTIIWRGTDTTGPQIFCIGDEHLQFGLMPLVPQHHSVKEDSRAGTKPQA